MIFELFSDMPRFTDTNTGLKYILRKFIKYKKLIKRLKSDLEIEKLKNQNCYCQNFPNHIFKENDMVCIKVCKGLSIYYVVRVGESGGTGNCLLTSYVKKIGVKQKAYSALHYFTKRTQIVLLNKWTAPNNI